MFRKLTSSLSILSIATVGLVVANPAAAGVTSAVVTAPDSSYYGNVFALNNSKAVLVYDEYNDTTASLKSALLSVDGTLDHVEAIATETRDAHFNARNSVGGTSTPDGGLMLAYSMYDQDSSTVYITATSDGEEWSTPIQVTPEITISDPFMCMMMHDCGYTDPLLSVDKNGLMALSYYVSSGSGTLKQYFMTSIGGNSWSAPTVVTSTASFFGDTRTLTPLPTGGMLATWTEYSNATPVTKYSVLTGGAVNFWSRPKTVSVREVQNIENAVIQTDPTHMTLFFGTNGDGTTSVTMQSYDLVSKTWSNGTNIITASNGYFYNGFKVHANANFVTSVAVGINTNAVTEGKAYFATLKNSVPDPQSVISVNTVNQGMGLDGVYTNADGSAYVLISGKSDDIARVLHVVGGAAVETTPLTGLTAPSWEAKSAISSGGTFFSVVNRGSQSPQAITHVTATLPVATGTPSITGKATTGKTLTARIPTFGGISGAGVAQVQWYSCTTKTTGVQTSVPAGCVAIAKATAAKYKVTTKVKKKYLGFAVKSTNFAGTTLLFAGVQSKAK